MGPIDQSILLSSFSKEELLDCDLAQKTITAILKLPLGEEGVREIDLP